MRRAFGSAAFAEFLPVLLAVLAFGAASASSTAFAQKQKIILDEFGGPSSDRLRQAVGKALDRMSSVDVVSDKKLAAVQADLGLMQTSDAYGAVARELKAAGFVSGSVSGGKKARAKIVVRDADGNVVGDAAWSGSNPAKAVASAEGGLATSLSELLSKLKGGGGGAVAAAPKPEKPAKAEPEEKKPEPVAAAEPERTEKPEKGKKGKRKREAEEAAPPPAPDDSSTSDVSAAAERPDTVPESKHWGPGWTGLDLAIGITGYTRSFDFSNETSDGSTFTPPADAPQTYDLGGAPAVVVRADYFFMPMVGVSVGGEVTPPGVVVSKDERSGTTYKTTSYAAYGGVKGKFDVGPIELLPSVTGGLHVFTVDAKNPSSANAPRVPPVQYTYARPGLDMRVGLGSTLALLAGGGYRLVLDAGGIKKDYFPHATATGIDAYAGAGFFLPFARSLEWRATVDFRDYVFAMNSKRDDVMDGKYIAGGARDRYIGITVGVAFRAF